MHERAKNAETVAVQLINYSEAPLVLYSAGQMKVIKCIVMDFKRDEAAEAKLDKMHNHKSSAQHASLDHNIVGQSRALLLSVYSHFTS